MLGKDERAGDGRHAPSTYKSSVFLVLYRNCVLLRRSSSCGMVAVDKGLTTRKLPIGSPIELSTGIFGHVLGMCFRCPRINLRTRLDLTCLAISLATSTSSGPSRSQPSFYIHDYSTVPSHRGRTVFQYCCSNQGLAAPNHYSTQYCNTDLIPNTVLSLTPSKDPSLFVCVTRPSTNCSEVKRVPHIHPPVLSTTVPPVNNNIESLS